jgi:hypothetical protein
VFTAEGNHHSPVAKPSCCFSAEVASVAGVWAEFAPMTARDALTLVAWVDRRAEFRAICAMSPEERAQLAGGVWTEIPYLPEQGGPHAA